MPIQYNNVFVTLRITTDKHFVQNEIQFNRYKTNY